MAGDRDPVFFLAHAINESQALRLELCDGYFHV